MNAREFGALSFHNHHAPREQEITMSTTTSEETETASADAGAAGDVKPGADPLAGYNAARTALENERASLTASRKRNEDERVRYRQNIDKRLEEIHVALHGPRRRKTAKAST